MIFVHGCFWHAHSCSRGFKPKTNVEFWLKKLRTNQLRDERAVKELSKAGWECLTIWECELSDVERLGERIKEFLEGGLEQQQ